jgi:hypothetical protein
MSTSLDEDHGYMGGSMCSMQDTIEEFDEEEEFDEDEERL